MRERYQQSFDAYALLGSRPVAESRRKVCSRIFWRILVRGNIAIINLDCDQSVQAGYVVKGNHLHIGDVPACKLESVLFLVSQRSRAKT